MNFRSSVYLLFYIIIITLGESTEPSPNQSDEPQDDQLLEETGSPTANEFASDAFDDNGMFAYFRKKYDLTKYRTCWSPILLAVVSAKCYDFNKFIEILMGVIFTFAFNSPSERRRENANVARCK